LNYELSPAIYPSTHCATSDKHERNSNNDLMTWHYGTQK